MPAELKLYAIMKKGEEGKWQIVGVEMEGDTKPQPAISTIYENMVGMAMMMQEQGMKGHHVVEFTGKLPNA